MAVNLSNLASMNAMEIAQAAQNVADAQGIGDEYREVAAEGHETRDTAQKSFDRKTNRSRRTVIIVAIAVAVAIAIVAFILVKRKK
ncbi:MAG: hypothetical protein IIX06_00855 [Bacteroidales bacterium]|nr:hypothetical protein [Bacteroidales bacterium]